MRSHEARKAPKSARLQLLTGISLVAFAAALNADPAHAQASRYRGAGGTAGMSGAPAVAVANLPGLNNNAAASAGSARALAVSGRIQSATAMAQQAQAAARQAALALQSNVPNGLATGGLMPALGAKGADQDASGLITWEGADLPTQAGNEVAVRQTEARALLSWETFNVGAQTSLTFDQSQGGVPQSEWIVLNRVVGQLDPATGRRNPALAAAPSQILGSIKAPGTVLVINQNGVLFGGASQIATGSLLASSLEVGRALAGTTPMTIKQRNNDFLSFGLLGFADQASSNEQQSAFTLSAQQFAQGAARPLDAQLEGAIKVEAGARIATADSGFVILAGPKVDTAGQITSNQGQVALVSGRQVRLRRSEGSAESLDPNVRGLLVETRDPGTVKGDYARNTGLIQTPQGYATLNATETGAVINAGAITATTSVARNGFVSLNGADVRLAPGSLIAVTPDDNDGTIPGDPVSLEAFRPSRIKVGDSLSRIEIGAGSLTYAPSGNIEIGSAPGEGATRASAGSSRIFVDTGAVIDASGLKDVAIPSSRHLIAIRPVKRNELRDTPNYREGFLNGATIYVDPRLSGVREDGVAWVGSPLVEADSYAQQVGIKTSELMTRGGNVSLGVSNATQNIRNPIEPDASQTPDVIVKPGSVIDVSGGWVRYDAGQVQTTRLINAAGQVVDIGVANPNDTYVGVYSGFISSQPRYGIEESYANPLFSGARFEPAYTEGRDAGSLTVKSSSVALDGQVFAEAYAGPRQIMTARTGTGTTSVFGDRRPLQASPAELPAGGFLHIQMLGLDAASGTTLGGGDAQIVDESELPADTSGLQYGQSALIDPTGQLVTPTRPDTAMLADERRTILSLSDDRLSRMGLGQFSLETTGALSVSKGADVRLSPGGVFEALTGRAITVEGAISAAGGQISLETAAFPIGSVFSSEAAALGDFDININGSLSAKGRWINDFNVASSALEGAAYIDGGKVSLTSAPRVTDLGDVVVRTSGRRSTTDISGSILVNDGALIDVSGGGYVAQNGALNLTSRGGDVSLTNETTYFQLTTPSSGSPPNSAEANRLRALAVSTANFNLVAASPDVINARVTIGKDTIRGHGFSGGGAFSLTTPEFSFGEGVASTGTQLSAGFLSSSGFGDLTIRSYKTALIPNLFSSNAAGATLAGFNAVLATQTVTIGAGESLSLIQGGYDSLLFTGQQIRGLQALGSGGDLRSVIAPSVPADGFRQRAANLTLDGLLELHVASGGSITGAAGASLTASKILNEGRIRLPGGSLNQVETLPLLVTANNTVAVSSLDDAFSQDASGRYRENLASLYDPTVNNGQLALRPIYLTGKLGRTDGIVLAAGSVTDLSGASLRDPFADALPGGRQLIQGRVAPGGAVSTAPSLLTGATLFHNPADSTAAYALGNPQGVVVARGLIAEAKSTLDLSGASDTYDLPDLTGGFAPTPVWSDAGSLSAGGSASLLGAAIRAQGGAALALGGVLTLTNPVIRQTDAGTPAATISADGIEAAGFDTLVSQGRLSVVGDVDLALGRGLFVTGSPWDRNSPLTTAANRQALAPVVSSTGDLKVRAPYISFSSPFQRLDTPLAGTVGTGTASFIADAIDVSGGVLFDTSLATVEMTAASDLRLTGVRPYQQTFNLQDAGTIPNSLFGQLAVNGDLKLTAGAIYPTTGSSFAVTSAGAASTITLARPSLANQAPPYSAGGDLTIQAANIVQGGVLQVPVGKLTLGGAAPLTVAAGGAAFAPATDTVRFAAGGLTSVSANGLSIPYGVTIDQTEYFFNPTSADKLSAPPAARLGVAGAEISVDAGAAINVGGGGDLYAYEFISGTGGSRDVLDRFNADSFSSNDGFQYPDQRQVYAIVPGLSAKTAAALDPIYSSDYGDLYSAAGAGRSVYLNGGAGVAPGWYTLLPAKYALLPGGMRLVENTAAATPPPGASTRLKDGTSVVTGYYGVASAGARSSTARVFEVQTQAVFRQYSNIALTSANATFTALAAKAGQAAPRLPIDAARLSLSPSLGLVINAPLFTTPGAGGRGAEADISGAPAFRIVSALDGAPASQGIQLTADALTALNVSSLLIGGTRTDDPDGSTVLDIQANRITVSNDAAHPLIGGEVLLGVDGAGSSITLEDGAVIQARGQVGPADGDYRIDGAGAMTGQGALARVSNGAVRAVVRSNVDAAAAPGLLAVGAASLSGSALLLDSSGDLTIDPGAPLNAGAISLGAAKVSFADQSTGLSGLVITPALRARLAGAQSLSIRSPAAIDFAAGAYGFGGLSLDAPGLRLSAGGAVSITAGALALSNSSGDLGACTAGGPLACGAGQLTIVAQALTFGDGLLRSYGAGGGVRLDAIQGVFAQGRGGFDAGDAPLEVRAPFIGDQAVVPKIGQSAVLPRLSLSTTGALVVSNPGGAAATTPEGVPGAELALSGQTVLVSGARLRATAGRLTIDSVGALTVGAGARLETPAYARNFGDSVDPYAVSAPGGLLSLTSATADIMLQAGSTLSVGGTGEAGDLVLRAANGVVAFGGGVDAAATEGQASFTLDTAGPFDFNAFAQGFGRAFHGDLDIRTASGGLALGAGGAVKARNARLTADGGLVDIAGRIDVSGVSGGRIALYGASGVTLQGTARLDAHADGYALDDTRSAAAGVVELGTQGSGALTVQSGAAIDLGARRTGDRLVPTVKNGVTYYGYVAGDRGGELLMRAPVVAGAGGAPNVNVAFAGAVAGADRVSLEGFRSFDLAAVAASGQFTGVTVAGGVATLDAATAGTAAQPNFLADVAPGTLPDFVQNFDISAAYGRLGGMAGQANFHARPGIDLTNAGDIVLASNLNLGAGTVDVAGAKAAGLMAANPTVAGADYVLPGQESAIFSRFTAMTYRTGGRVDGEAPVLSLRAGGDLDLRGSITDGFFAFRDQTHPAFLAVQTSVFNASNANWIPYSALANGVAALGAGTAGAGDAVGTAELFPLLSLPGGGAKAVDSASFRLAGGASLTGVDPMAIDRASGGGVILQGTVSYRYASGARATTVVARNLVRTGSGSIEVAAAGDVDLRNGPLTYRTNTGATATAANGFQVGGSAIYTAGQRVAPGIRTATDIVTGAVYTVDPTSFASTADVFAARTAYRYGAGDSSANGIGAPGVLLANAVYASGGGDVSLTAGGDVLGRRDAAIEALLNRGARNLQATGFIGSASQPWRVGLVGMTTDIRVNPQLFREGVGVLGGGRLSVSAGGDVFDLATVSTTSVTTAAVTGGVNPTRALMTFGGGDLSVAAGGSLLGGRIDVGSGSAVIATAGSIVSAGTTGGFNPPQNTLRVRLTDADVSLRASQTVVLQGVTALGVQRVEASAAVSTSNANAYGFYSDKAKVSVLANGEVTVENRGADVLTADPLTGQPGKVTAETLIALYPGSFSAASVTGDLKIVSNPVNAVTAADVLLYPSPVGTLSLAAGRDITGAILLRDRETAPLNVAMLDGDTGLLPGVFSSFAADANQNIIAGQPLVFPAVLPNTTNTQRAALHRSTPVHAGDAVPNRVFAGGDILNMVLATPKQTRVGAGRDIVNMMFFGQNLADGDISRIVAGRDIIATTTLVAPTITNPGGAPLTIPGAPQAALQGNTFVIGGPGLLSLEAGRDLGPFLNSAVTDGYFAVDSSTLRRTGRLTFGGGVISVGNEWNPWLPAAGASLNVAFGVGKGADYAALRDFYLDPANIDRLPDYLFVQDTDANGELTPDRSQPIYSPILVDWMKANAPSRLPGGAVTYEEAYAAFKTLPQLQQRRFLTEKLFFNELVQTSVPGPSFLTYSRGFGAANLLFPASLGYTLNNTSGGAAGATERVATGDLDLRLATLQTARGGDIYILGPGGRVLGGSTVRTSEQAARRVYSAGAQFGGRQKFGVLASTIQSIPTGFEGVLTLRGGGIASFTDGDFLLNQSRLFTEQGGDIALWSSNGDLNAGQGPRTSANFPPVVVRIDENAFSEVDQAGAVSGAGIAAFEPAPGVPAPNVYLIAPRGTVDAGDAGVRVSGNLFIAAQAVANSNNFSVSGSSVGVGSTSTVNAGATAGAGAAANAASQAAEQTAQTRAPAPERSVVTVNVTGYVDPSEICTDPNDDRCRAP